MRPNVKREELRKDEAYWKEQYRKVVKYWKGKYEDLIRVYSALRFKTDPTTEHSENRFDDVWTRLTYLATVVA